jgi:hypothetical protein
MTSPANGPGIVNDLETRLGTAIEPQFAQWRVLPVLPKFKIALDKGG